MNYRDLMAKLEDFIADFDVPLPYWVADGNDDGNDGGVYCRDHAVVAVAKAGGDAILDGGWSLESDGCRHCETCSRVLQYSLTNYGIDSEISHFLGNQPTKPLGEEEAYHIERILCAAPDNPDALQVAEMAVGAMP